MMDMDDKVAAMMAVQAREKANQRLQDAVNVLQRSMYEILRYQERLQDCKTDKERAQVVNWAVNYLVCNITPNLRIDLLADSQAELRALIGGQGDE
jgi:hypothetical protein